MSREPAPPPAAAELPLVSVGIPTYNRVGTLRRTVESVLAQDYPRLEIVISDNASTDGTQAYCEAAAAGDSRVRYVRQPVNAGAEANFRRALELASGPLFMWLADDDWIDPEYISLCVERLVQPEYSLVAGTAQYYRAGAWEAEGPPTTLLQDDPAERVVAYFSQVADNGVLYGVTRREFLVGDGIPGGIGSDWLLVAGLAFRGKVATVAGASIHRAMEGASDGLESLSRAYRLRGRTARNPYGLIGRGVRRYILWAGPAFRKLGLLARARLARRAAREVHRRYYLVVRGYNRSALLAQVGRLAALRRLLGAWRRWRGASPGDGVHGGPPAAKSIRPL